MRLRASGRLIYSPVSPGSEAIFFCQGMRWLPVMFCHAGPSSLIFSDSDLQIQISQNGLHLKLKLHPLWRTTLWLKLQTKNYFGFTHASSKVHFRSTEGQTFYWSIMTADDSIKCRCANSGMTGQVGGFQNPGVCLQAFPSFLSNPLHVLLLAPFVARSVWLSFLVLCS